MSQQEFANECIDAFRKKYPDVSFTLESDFSISGKKGDLGMKFNLDNIYVAYEAQPGSLKTIIGNYLTIAERGFTGKKGAFLASIIPVIKPVEYLDGIREATKSDSVGIINEKYNDQLIVVYGQDSEASIEYLNVKAFKELNISMDSLHHIAMDNLKRVVVSLNWESVDGIHLIKTIGGYESSLILFPGLWTKDDTISVEGDWVIAIPTGNVLVATGSKNKEALAKVKEVITKSYKESNYRISDKLFKWNGDKFELFRN
ncbi:DUF1444 family protein [Chitinophaga filiformis]|nr:DUF1444 family protein [Chitinophaga filiformis]